MIDFEEAYRALFHNLLMAGYFWTLMPWPTKEHQWYRYWNALLPKLFPGNLFTIAPQWRPLVGEWSPDFVVLAKLDGPFGLTAPLGPYSHSLYMGYPVMVVECKKSSPVRHIRRTKLVQATNQAKAYALGVMRPDLTVWDRVYYLGTAGFDASIGLYNGHWVYGKTWYRDETVSMEDDLRKIVKSIIERCPK